MSLFTCTNEHGLVLKLIDYGAIVVAMDTPDRVGIAEMKHVEGLYAFWDALLARNPGLLIDNCASGGRRIDLETIGRSVPLWRTDYSYFEPNGYQCHTYGLQLFLPCSGTGDNNPQKYYFRSSMGGAVVMGWELNNSFNVSQAHVAIAEFKTLCGRTSRETSIR